MSVQPAFQEPRRRSASVVEAGSEWSPDEVEELRQLARRGLKSAAIATLLGRTPAAIRAKSAKCGIDLVNGRACAPVTLRRFKTIETA